MPNGGLQRAQFVTRVDSQKITACSIVCFSSRILPGHQMV
jgi:hypothetical protein